MGFRRARGMDGFRIDAALVLIACFGVKTPPERDPFLVLSGMRDVLSWRKAGAIMPAGANLPREAVCEFFGGGAGSASGAAAGAGERMHMILDCALDRHSGRR